MAGVAQKFMMYLGLMEEDGYDRGYEDRFEDEQRDEVEPASRYAGEPRSARYANEPPAASSVATVRRVDAGPARTQPSATRRPDPMATTSPYRITTLHPRTYNEARTIGEHFRDGSPVIMNLTEMDDNDAKRLVDFAAGLIFGLHGSIERVTQKVFLLSPANIEVTAEDKARIVEGNFFNQS